MTRILACGFVLIAMTMTVADDAKKGGEWTDLLQGDLTKHWTTKGNWSLDKDGVTTLTPRPGEKGWSRFDAYLWSKKTDYDQFECEFEYKLEKGGKVLLLPEMKKLPHSIPGMFQTEFWSPMFASSSKTASPRRG